MESGAHDTPTARRPWTTADWIISLVLFLTLLIPLGALLEGLGDVEPRVLLGLLPGLAAWGLAYGTVELTVRGRLPALIDPLHPRPLLWRLPVTFVIGLLLSAEVGRRVDAGGDDGTPALVITAVTIVVLLAGWHRLREARA